MESNIDISLGSLKINHIGYLYKDAEKQAKIMESLFKMPKFVFSDDLDHAVTYRGGDSKFSLKMGFSQCFSTQIEVYQWLGGDCAYKEFIDAGKEGLHHIGVNVENMEDYVNEFQKQGIEVLMTGTFPPRLKFAYMDTEESFGIIIEFIEIIKRKRKRKK